MYLNERLVDVRVPRQERRAAGVGQAAGAPFVEVALADNVIRAGRSQCATVCWMSAASPASTTLARLAITRA
ncbi:hypothetical protein ACFY1B_47420 [Streptomyces mirabilis]|uniref:hypothetical protein n=1 Tax=Streptomyces mirabilis TaxID=68239 RepID=UPI00368D23E6